MMACCKHCYEKYITSDGKIDWDLYLKIEPMHSEEESPPVCKCMCHRVDLTVLH